MLLTKILDFITGRDIERRFDSIKETVQNIKTGVKDLEEENASLRSLLDEAIAALEPFARYSGYARECQHDDAMECPIGDLRRAAATLTKLRTARND
jgi:hypothetical protein